MNPASLTLLLLRLIFHLLLPNTSESTLPSSAQGNVIFESHRNDDDDRAGRHYDEIVETGFFFYGLRACSCRFSFECDDDDADADAPPIEAGTWASVCLFAADERIDVDGFDLSVTNDDSGNVYAPVTGNTVVDPLTVVERNDDGTRTRVTVRLVTDLYRGETAADGNDNDDDDDERQWSDFTVHGTGRLDRHPSDRGGGIAGETRETASALLSFANDAYRWFLSTVFRTRTVFVRCDDGTTAWPSTGPTALRSATPTRVPSINPTAFVRSATPSVRGSTTPSLYPSNEPTDAPSNGPTDAPSNVPTDAPSFPPSVVPSNVPTVDKKADDALPLVLGNATATFRHPSNGGGPRMSVRYDAVGRVDRVDLFRSDCETSLSNPNPLRVHVDDDDDDTTVVAYEIAFDEDLMDDYDYDDDPDLVSFDDDGNARVEFCAAMIVVVGSAGTETARTSSSSSSSSSARRRTRFSLAANASSSPFSTTIRTAAPTTTIHQVEIDPDLLVLNACLCSDRFVCDDGSSSDSRTTFAPGSSVSFCVEPSWKGVVLTVFDRVALTNNDDDGRVYEPVRESVADALTSVRRFGRTTRVSTVLVTGLFDVGGGGSESSSSSIRIEGRGFLERAWDDERRTATTTDETERTFRLEIAVVATELEQQQQSSAATAAFDWIVGDLLCDGEDR